MTQYSPSVHQADTLNLGAYPDLNYLPEMATRQRDAFIAHLIRQSVSRLKKAFLELLTPPVNPHNA